MWDYAEGFFNKKTGLNRLHKLTGISIANKERPIALLINGKFGVKNNFQLPALFLGIHNHYRNQQIWLRLDDPGLQAKFSSDLENCFCINKKINEAPLFLPMLERYCIHLNEDRKQILESNLEFIQNNPNKLQQLCDLKLNYKYPDVDNLDLDAALYSLDFPTEREKQARQSFHNCDLQEKIAFIDKFTNDKQRTLARRILLRNFGSKTTYDKSFTNLLTSIYQDDAITNNDYKNKPRKTINEVRKTIDKLRTADLSKAQMQQLDDLSEYLDLLNNMELS